MALPIGVMFSASNDLRSTASELISLGFRDGQLAIPPEVEPESIEAPQGLTLHTLFGVYEGESYADIPTVQRTVGFVPEATRQEREQRSLAIIETAARLGVPGFATHVGFIPHDTRSETYVAVREMVRRLADRAAAHGMTFALETGQETAQCLLEFLLDVNRDNVGVNFDPANMILYGTGDPVEALEVVGQHLITVHCKDGVWPSAAAPESLGVEQPLGEGQVEFPAFLAMLKKFGYEKPLFIEREVSDPATRIQDLKIGKRYLESLLSRF